MPEKAENNVRKPCGSVEVLLLILSNRKGLALVWIVITMVIFSAVGGAMVSFYAASTSEHLRSGLTHQARLMAESGRRFFETEYRNQDSEIEKNKLLADNFHGKTFNPVIGENNHFSLDITSYFCRVETDPGGGSTLKAKFVGNAGFSVPSTGSFRIEGETTVYHYTSVSGPDASDVYTFTLDQNASAPVYTGVYPVVSSNFAAVAEGGTLTLDAGLGDIFPSENGMFLIRETPHPNLPVSQAVPYLYAYRNGDQLVHVTAPPGRSRFRTIDAANPGNIEIAKFLEVRVTGFFENEARVENTYRLAVPSSHSIQGLKSFWNFDDEGAGQGPLTDKYGTQDLTLVGDAQVTTTAGEVKVGTGALKLAGTGYVETEFNPALQLGAKQPFTVSFWAKPDAVADAFSSQAVIGSGDLDGVNRFFVGIRKDENGIRWVWGLGNTEDLTGGSLPSVAEGLWQHVAFQLAYDQVNLKYDTVFYLNGREVYRQEYTGTGDLSTAKLDLGALATESGEHRFKYSGLLDEVAIFNKALSICDVREIFNVPCNVGCGDFYAGDNPPADPVAWYPFNGNANDESGESQQGNPDSHLIPSGAVLTTDRFGCGDRAYAFDGSDDYLFTGTQTTDHPLDVSDEDRVTVAAWIKRNAVGSGTETIVNHSASYVLELVDGQPSFVVYEDLFSPFMKTASTPINDTGWHFIVGVFDGSELKIYVDGVEQEPDNPAVPREPNWIAPPFIALFFISSETNAFNGNIDDVSIWNIPLTGDQISDYYNLTRKE